LPQWGWHDRDYTIKDTSASPLITPGEVQQGVAASGPIWHFQDDAVTGKVDVGTFINTAGVQQVQNVTQFLPTFQPTHYLDNIDGPQGISQFSKDLAFQLFTTQVPEPATVSLAAMVMAGVLGIRRRFV
jgi:hypothetical protein